MLALQMAVAVTAGSPFFDRAIREPGAALLICAEDDRDELHRRLHAAAAGLPDCTAVIARLFIRSMVGENNLMTTVVERGEVRRTTYVDRLILTAKAIPDLRLIVVDPASRFRGGDENAAQDATRFIEELERLRVATGATVLVVHHANKGSLQADEALQGAARGSSALSDAVRWQMNLNRLGKEAAKALKIEESRRGLFVVATVTKSNYGPYQPPVVLHRGDHGVLSVVGDSASDALASMRDLIEAVRREAKEGRCYSKDGFERRFAGLAGILKTSHTALRARMNDAIEKGYLSYEKKKLAVGPNKPSEF